MPPAAGPVIIGAGVGAGVAALTGGDPWKGALYGGIGGGLGGAMNPYSIGGATQFASASTVGGVVGGAYGGYAVGALGKMMRLPSALDAPVARAAGGPSPLARVADEKKHSAAMLSERLKKARSRAASRVMLPGQISEMANVQRPILSELLG